MGRDMNTFELLALKEFDHSNKSAEALFSAELAVFQRLGEHRNVPKFSGYIFKVFERKAYIVLEYLPFPTLASFLKEHGPMSEENALFVLYQLVRVYFY
jgi:serine/threonine protein kinase